MTETQRQIAHENMVLRTKVAELETQKCELAKKLEEAAKKLEEAAKKSRVPVATSLPRISASAF